MHIKLFTFFSTLFQEKKFKKWNYVVSIRIMHYKTQPNDSKWQVKVGKKKCRKKIFLCRRRKLLQTGHSGTSIDYVSIAEVVKHSATVTEKWDRTVRKCYVTRTFLCPSFGNSPDISHKSVHDHRTIFCPFAKTAESDRELKKMLSPFPTQHSRPSFATFSSQ